jgi:hypothetical protein
MMYEADRLPKDAAEKIRPAFEKSLADQSDFWVEQCRAGNAQYWRSDDGAYSAITEVRDTEKGRVFHMVASAGSYRPSLLEEGENWGREMGCAFSMTEGRPGWAKLLDGYKAVSVQYMKEL